MTAGKTAIKELFMNKSRFLIVALISVLMVVGLVLVSCGSKCPGGGNSGGAGNCERTIIPVATKGCTNTDGCAVFNSISVLKVTCDC
jgi:hypothetical protein